MKIENVLSAKGFAFLVLFTLAALVASGINFSKALGAENQQFTFFQFIGPIAGGFLGAGVGVLAVLLAQILSFAWLGKQVELLNVLRLLPMLFAALYFAKYARGKLAHAVVPLACIALFVAHPVGREAWFFALYWLVPAIALLLPENLFVRSLGATFSAHAVGGVVWVYFVPTTAVFWVALIPIVAYERLLFASGISISYYAINTVFSRVEAIVKSGIVSIDGRYVLAAQKTK